MPRRRRGGTHSPSRIEGAIESLGTRSRFRTGGVFGLGRRRRDLDLPPPAAVGGMLRLRGVLVGRAEECQAVDALIRAAADGFSAVLVLRGEAGIGKTALLDYAVESAADVQVTRTAGVESEMEFGYAGLHQLLLPFLDGASTLPPPQRRVLASAFGEEVGPQPNRFLITLATLTLMADAATTRPVLCVIDDAQWVDEESTSALAAVARRLHADGIAMLISVREPADVRLPFERLPTLELSGLSPEAARQVVSGVLGAEERGRGFADRVVAEAGGNPLALVTFASESPPEGLTVDSGSMGPLPIGNRLEARYLRWTRALPPAAQTLVLTAAADPTGDQDMLWSAGELLGFTPADAHVGGLSDLLEIGSRVRFCHPLMRSAVYHGASHAERSRVHAALAAVTNPTTEAERRAWHRAAAVGDFDEAVAKELETAATLARERGGLATAAAFLSRAAQVTADPEARAERLLSAAQAHWMAGSDASAVRLLEEAEPTTADASTKARSRRLHAAVAATRTFGISEWIRVLDDVRSAIPHDAGLVRATMLDALAANILSSEALSKIARLGIELRLTAADPSTATDLLLEGLCLSFGASDDRAAAPLLRRAFESLDVEAHSPIDAYTLLLCASNAAAAIGDFRALHHWGSRLESMGRRLGAAIPTYIGLTGMAAADHGTGSLTSALRRWSLDGEAIRDLLPPQLFVGDVIALAWRGDEHATRELESSQVRWQTDHNRVGFQPTLDWAMAVLENGLGNYDEAFHRAASANPAAYLFRDLVLMELVEASVRSGRDQEAVSAVEQIAARAEVNPGALFDGFLARSRALLADDAGAEALYLDAIDFFQAADASVHRARASLLYGEWLRRQRRRSDARAHLREAYASFVSMGATGFADRARHELAATGEKVRRRSVEAARQLTPQEDRIARLAAEGDTNPEIASKMFLSPATVEYHLRKVYRKLNATSRRDLRRLLVATT
jgi:DNA-binding CsgD family transcriptional regulator